MDFNDLEFRIKRIYNLLDKRFEHNIEENSKKYITKSENGITGNVTATIKFGTYPQEELVNRALGIICAIAALKDHLKLKYKQLSKDPQDVESFFNSSEELKLILALCNKDKHGGHSRKHQQSNKNPKLLDIKQSLITTFKYGEEDRIAIVGKVVDENDKFIMSLEEMITKGMAQIEQFLTSLN